MAPPPSILLAGTYEVQYDTGSTWEQVESPPYVERRGGWGWRLLTVPAVLAVLGAMFSFAYAETLLRGVRRQRGRLRVADVTGMTGVGAILGLVLVVLAWMTGRFPEWEHVMITVALTAASAGLVAFAVSARAERRVGSRATPR